jgi:hypothetical protein
LGCTRGELWYHGTDVGTVLRFLSGAPLDAAEAAARKIDGPPGFFLAADALEAEYYAVRRSPGAILEMEISQLAMTRLLGAGMIRQPMPSGARFTAFDEELVIPPQAFSVFEQLRASGDIELRPLGVP